MTNKILLIAALAVSLNAHADLTIDSYMIRSQAGQTEILEAWFDGAVTAYSWANSQLATMKQPPLYCPPPRYAMGGNSARELFDRFMPRYLTLAKGIPRDQIMVGMGLLYALRDAFPCAPPSPSPSPSM